MAMKASFSRLCAVYHAEHEPLWQTRTGSVALKEYSVVNGGMPVRVSAYLIDAPAMRSAMGLSQLRR